MDRVKNVFATGNEGTLSNYYKNLEGKFYAKTGTLSGVVALSGYLHTRKNKLLLVSILVNNHQTSATTVRRAVEQFVNTVYEKY
jgi:D-alanyl-D-alanine carboxypeptidase/D-alanyl-D-alanine-endopeptidase (penicillin-binding protein 4)